MIAGTLIDVKRSEAGILGLLALFLIAATAVLEYYSPSGVFLSWGYVIAIFISATSKDNTVIVSTIIFSFFFITLSFFYFQKDVPYKILVFNKGYACLGIMMTSLFVLRSRSSAAQAENHRSQMHGIFSHGTQGIILMEEAGTIALLNPFSEKMFQYTASELTGTNIGSLIDGLAVAESVTVTHPGKEALPKVLMARRKDGSTFPVEITMNKYRTADRSYVVAFITDITKRKEDEDKLRAQKKELEDVNKELEAFSYSVSHDLRAPLRAVGGFAKMLEEDYGSHLDSAGKRFLIIIRESAEQMGSLIDDLLSFSRLGKKEIRKTRVDMRELASSTLFEINKSLSHKAEVVIGDLHPALADRSLMGHVFTNLLSNAIKYSSKVAEPKVLIRSEDVNHEIVYSISDNGAGFDMKYSQKLFGVFQRLHTNDDFEGTGVGLAIVHRIIQKHGGRVWAEGKEGAGATFSFVLSPAIEKLPAQTTRQATPDNNKL